VFDVIMAYETRHDTATDAWYLHVSDTEHVFHQKCICCL